MRLLCLQCAAELELEDDVELSGCPSCGDSQGVPANLDDTVTIYITKHELRVLTFWADGYARTCIELGRDRAETMPRVVQTIVARLATQTDAALTFAQEISDVRAAFPDSEVRVYRAGELTDE